MRATRPSAKSSESTVARLKGIMTTLLSHSSRLYLKASEGGSGAPVKPEGGMGSSFG